MDKNFYKIALKTAIDFSELQIEMIKNQCNEYIYVINELKKILNVSSVSEVMEKVKKLNNENKEYGKMFCFTNDEFSKFINGLYDIIENESNDDGKCDSEYSKQYILGIVDYYKTKRGN